MRLFEKWRAIGILLVTGGLYLQGMAQKLRPVIRFGVIADVQYCDCETRGNRFYRNALSKLDACVSDLNKEGVQFTVVLGDLTDRDAMRNQYRVLERLNRLEGPVYHTTGNHDYGGIPDNEMLYRSLGMPAPYYAFTREGWRFIFLNTNDVAPYAHVGGTPKEAELQAMLERIKETGRTNDASYNGGVGREQMVWLEKELERAERNGERVLILSHHPLYGAPGLTALNDLEIVALITRYECVKGAISGHHHAGAYGEYGGIPFITTEGMIETETENAYSVADIYPDCVRLTGKGRSRSYTFPLE